MARQRQGYTWTGGGTVVRIEWEGRTGISAHLSTQISAPIIAWTLRDLTKKKQGPCMVRVCNSFHLEAEPYCVLVS